MGFWMSRLFRLLALIVVAVFAVAVVACGDGDVAAEPTSVLVPGDTATSTNVPVPIATVSSGSEVATVAAEPTSAPIATATQVLPDTPAPAVRPTASPTAAPVVSAFDESRFADIAGIVDPTNFGWPRSIETSEGLITLEAPPQRIHSLSLGHSEILAALMDFDRLTAVYGFFVDEEQSNIAGLSADHTMIGYDPEEVVALEPEVIIAARFTNADTVALMNGANIPVARTNLENSALGNVPNILLIGYMIGAEVEAIELAEQIESRMQFISDILPAEGRQRVLSISKYTSVFAAGSGTTEGGIIEQAGGINAAGDSGIEGHQQVSVESIAAINPDVIIVPQPLESADAFIEELVSDPALAEVPAVKNGQVFYVPPRYHTTLSHWNVHGIERLATLLFPSAFSGVTFEEFLNWEE
jgi:iron complex transport system substrate-binding protein